MNKEIAWKYLDSIFSIGNNPNIEEFSQRVRGLLKSNEIEPKVCERNYANGIEFLVERFSVFIFKMDRGDQKVYIALQELDAEDQAAYPVKNFARGNSLLNLLVAHLHQEWIREIIQQMHSCLNWGEGNATQLWTELLKILEEQPDYRCSIKTKGIGFIIRAPAGYVLQIMKRKEEGVTRFVGTMENHRTTLTIEFSEKRTVSKFLRKVRDKLLSFEILRSFKIDS